MAPNSSVASEEDRVRHAYARRSADARYSWFSRGNLWMVQRRERDVLDALRRNGLTDLTDKIVLDVGCGYGQWLGDLIKWGARPENLSGVDLLPDRIARARTRLPQEVMLRVGSATNLPAADASCDIVILSTVFSSILDEATRRQVATEALRVLKPAIGLVIWYDFFLDNPRNSDVRGVRKAHIRSLFPDCALDLRRTTLAPPISRRVAPFSWFACGLLDAVPLLRTHYVGVLRRTT